MGVSYGLGSCIEQETGTRPAYEELPVMLTGWLNHDRKLAGLKALQGMIWEEGYRQREFAPKLYGDVLPAFTQWRVCGIRLGIYSSGSEQAQRLLLAHTNAGDVTSLLEHFFDTSVGEKKTAASYRTISEQIGMPPHDILFLSDAEDELELQHRQDSGPPTLCGLEPMQAPAIPCTQISDTFSSKDRSAIDELVEIHGKTLSEVTPSTSTQIVCGT